MPKCYVMIEDLPGTTEKDVQFQYAFDLGLPEGAELPKTIDDMTPAQEAAWNLYTVLRMMVDEKLRESVKHEVNNQIVVPEHIAREG